MTSYPRNSPMDFYHPVDTNLFITSILDSYRLPLSTEPEDTVLIVSISSSDATFLVIAYTVLVTIIFMAACELVTLLVLTFFRVGRSGTRHAMLVAYYNAGSPSRILPLMLGYIYNGLFCCRKNSQWAVDWTAVTASCLLFTIAFSLISGDILTKFFLGGRALIQGNVAQANPNAVFYPAFGNLTNDPSLLFDSYTGPRPAAVYQAIARKTSTGYSKLHEDSESPITFQFESQTIPVNGSKETQWMFHYSYAISGYELGLRDAPGLKYAVGGHCETHHIDYASQARKLRINSGNNESESFNLYPFWGLMDSDSIRFIEYIALDRENYTAPWVSFQFSVDNPVHHQSAETGGWAFQLVPHTAHRLSFTENSLNADPWYVTESNPAWVENIDRDGQFNARFRVQDKRPPMRCIQNDTWTYNGRSVARVEELDKLEPSGLKLSPFSKFVLKHEFSIPVFAPILGYVPIGSLASAIHYTPRERRLDAAKANMTTDFLEFVQISYLYSREVVRNTILLFPSLEKDQKTGTNFTNIARSNSSYSTVDFLVDSQEVAALSVITLITTPSICALLWIVVLIWTCIFNSQSKLDNNTASGRHGLRRSALQATHLYLFLDEHLSNKRKWSGRQGNAPFIRNLDLEDSLPRERLSMMNPVSEKISTPKSTPVPDPFAVTPEMSSGFPKAKLVPVSEFTEGGGNSEGEKKGVWTWVKRNIFGIRRSADGVQYEVTMTKAWNPQISPVNRGDIREGV